MNPDDPNDMNGCAEGIVLLVILFVIIGVAAVLGLIGFGIWWVS